MDFPPDDTLQVMDVLRDTKETCCAMNIYGGVEKIAVHK
jgi:hypothetical protein